MSKELKEEFKRVRKIKEEREKKNSVQRIKIFRLDIKNDQLKHFKKCYMKAMFTRWERIKLFFMGIKI